MAIKLPVRLTTTRSKTIILLTAGVVLFAVSGALWWSRVYNDPERVFWQALEAGLNTQGVTKHIVQGTDQNSVEQVVHLNLDGQPNMRGETVLRQTGQDGTENVIATETIGTTAEDYIRYRDIQTDETDSEGQPLDIAQIEGVWSKEPSGEGEVTGQFLRETLFSTVPFAQFKPAQRGELMDFIRSNQVYLPDFSAVQKTNQGGRRVYVYQVGLQPQAYAGMLQQYGRLIGLGEVREFDPGAFEGAPTLVLEMTVDVASRQLVGVRTEDGRQETYSAYGAVLPLDLPADAISISELQQRLQDLQQ